MMSRRSVLRRDSVPVSSALHQAGIADDIGGEDGRQTALFTAFGHSTSLWAAILSGAGFRPSM